MIEKETEETLKKMKAIKYELGFLYIDIKAFEKMKHSLTKNAVTKEHRPLKIEITENDENHL